MTFKHYWTSSILKEGSIGSDIGDRRLRKRLGAAHADACETMNVKGAAVNKKTSKEIILLDIPHIIFMVCTVQCTNYNGV